MKIDVHWHHIPRQFVEAVLAGKCPIEGKIDFDGPEPAITVAHGFRLRLTDRLTGVEPAIAAMDAAGLDMVTPSIAPPLRQYDADPATGATICQFMNDSAARLITESAGRLQPLANVPLQDPTLAADELRRSILDLGLSGVAIGSNMEGTNIGEAHFAPFWQAVADLDAFVFIHPETVLGRERLRHHELENFVGFPIDTAVAVSSLIFDGVLERFGPLKICLAHGGGAFPYLVSRWQHGYRTRIAGETSTISDPYSYLGSVYSDSLTLGTKQLQFLAEVVGSDHIVLGSDYPFDMGDPQPVGTMEEAFQSPEQRTMIAGETAARLLAIESGQAG